MRHTGVVSKGQRGLVSSDSRVAMEPTEDEINVLIALGAFSDKWFNH